MDNSLLQCWGFITCRKWAKIFWIGFQVRNLIFIMQSILEYIEGNFVLTHLAFYPFALLFDFPIAKGSWAVAVSRWSIWTLELNLIQFAFSPFPSHFKDCNFDLGFSKVLLPISLWSEPPSRVGYLISASLLRLLLEGLNRWGDFI